MTEDIYNQALEMLQNGRSKQEVLFKFAKYQAELSPLLDLSIALFAMPKNIVPTPLMQHKYLTQTAKNAWLTWLHVSKFAGVSMSLILLLSAFTVTGYKALISAPGQKFFAIKQTAEKFQVLLAYNQNEKASLQIEIAKKRLTEAENIFNNPSSNNEEKTAALSELSKQTSTAIAQVSSVTKNNPSPEQSHPLINSLSSITREQKTLLSTIKPDADINTAANNAISLLKENSAKLTEIKLSVAIANNDQTLAKLTSDPDSVAVLGQITQIGSNQITVEKTAFQITAQTIIWDTTGTIVKIGDLLPKMKVNVVGKKNSGEATAMQIFMAQTDLIKPEVKGEETLVPVETPKSPTASPTPTSLTKPSFGTVDLNNSETQADTEKNTATVSAIFEPSDPQFAN